MIKLDAQFMIRAMFEMLRRVSIRNLKEPGRLSKTALRSKAILRCFGRLAGDCHAPLIPRSFGVQLSARFRRSRCLCVESAPEALTAEPQSTRDLQPSATKRSIGRFLRPPEGETNATIVTTKNGSVEVLKFRKRLIP